MPQQRFRRRSALPRRLGWTLSLALAAPASHGAAFLPGAEADPATGPLATSEPSAAEPLKSGGIVWAFAPWRSSGWVSLDGRWLQFEDQQRSREGLLIGDVEWASHLWQPWFLQMRFGMGFVASRADAGDGGNAAVSTGSAATGRMAISLFPASRFPFELRVDSSDSRVNGDSLTGDLRTERVAVSQSYRPETGNQSYHLQIDHSRIEAATATDTLFSVQATALQQIEDHSFELDTSYSNNERSDTGDHTRLVSLTGRHGFHPQSDLHVETLASWNDVRFGEAGQTLGSQAAQVSSFASWSPRAGEPFYSEQRPLTLAAGVRWVEARAIGEGDDHPVQALNATAGANLELSRSWRAGASLSTSLVRGGTLPGASSFGANGSLTWTPEITRLGEWRYAPSASGSLGVTDDSTASLRGTAGAQLSHSVARDWQVADQQSLAFSLAQSLGLLHETATGTDGSALSHSLAVSWQSFGEGAGQRFAALSISDSRTLTGERGSFQLVNLQLSQRAQLSRDTGVSANLTAQATRNQSTEVDVFTGQPRLHGEGWLPFYSGSLNLDQQRLFGVPRLRHTLLLALNSQQIESRALGDVNAPYERISESLESRLDYTIGRLEARLATRVARVDGRVVAAVLARLQRRF